MAWRGYWTALRLGWAIESNWTDPFLFAVYSVVKPLSIALILVVMFSVVSGGRRPEYLAFLIVGSAFWNLVWGSIAGLVTAMLEDRERYRTLKYLYVTPIPFVAMLAGRSTARLAATGTGALITLGVGVLFLGVEIDPLGVRWAMLALSMVVGLVAISSLGLVMAGVVLQLRQESWSYPEAVVGALYLLSGAVFPIDVLPGWLQPVSLGLPVTWWLEGVRRALLGEGAPGLMTQIPDSTVLLALIASSVVLSAAAWLAFGALERRARDRGLIDNTTGS